MLPVRRVLPGQQWPEGASTDDALDVWETATRTDVPRWLARIAVGVRVVALATIAVLVLLGPSYARQHLLSAGALWLLGSAYAVVLLLKPELEVRRTRFSVAVTAVDGGVTLGMIALTGGAASPAVAIIPLLIVAVSARSQALVAIGLSTVAAAAFALIIVATPTHRVDTAQEAVWWPPFMIMTAVLAAALGAGAEREQRSRAVAEYAAQIEHAAAEEERDLRTRLLDSHRSQQDGLKVLLHEFRTPLASLEALSDTLSDTARPMSREDRALSLRLAGEHIRHLNEMLNGLSDVASSWQPTFAMGRIRDVDLRDLVTAAADAAGLREPRLRVSVAEGVSTVYVDVPALRRIMTNLLENAARHGGDQPVDVTCRAEVAELQISVMDRGPGVAKESLGELTVKFVSLGERRGTAGLGLWIVQQILDATGGRLFFSERDGGGLVATVHLPMQPRSPRG